MFTSVFYDGQDVDGRWRSVTQMVVTQLGNGGRTVGCVEWRLLVFKNKKVVNFAMIKEGKKESWGKH